MIAGIYLYEIIPKNYGIKKHPLFFIKEIKKYFNLENNKKIP